jgi:transposase
LLSKAYGAATAAAVAVLTELNRQISLLETQLAELFDQHLDARIYHSLPGLGTILGARILGEFGDA